MSIQIRPTTYRGQGGYLICGTDGQRHQISIFTVTRCSAERIRVKVKAGQQTTLEDFRP